MPWTPLEEIDPGAHSEILYPLSASWDTAKEHFPALAKDLAMIGKDVNDAKDGKLNPVEALVHATELGKDTKETMMEPTTKVETTHDQKNEFLEEKQSQTKLDGNQEIIDKTQKSLRLERDELNRENFEIQKKWGEITEKEMKQNVPQSEMDQDRKTLHDRQAVVDKKLELLDNAQQFVDDKQRQVDQVQQNVDNWTLTNRELAPKEKENLRMIAAKHESDAVKHESNALENEDTAAKNAKVAEKNAFVREKQGHEMQEHRADQDLEKLRRDKEEKGDNLSTWLEHPRAEEKDHVTNPREVGQEPKEKREPPPPPPPEHRG